METSRAIAEKPTLSQLEQQVVMMVSTYENRCHFCTVT